MSAPCCQGNEGLSLPVIGASSVRLLDCFSSFKVVCEGQRCALSSVTPLGRVTVGTQEDVFQAVSHGDTLRWSQELLGVDEALLGIAQVILKPVPAQVSRKTWAIVLITGEETKAQRSSTICPTHIMNYWEAQDSHVGH